MTKLQAADLASRLEIVRKLTDDEFLIVMRQNPGDNHYWSKRVITFEPRELESILALALAVADHLADNERGAQ